MSTAMLIELAWKSALLSGATLLVLRLLSGRSAAERSWVAHAGVAALLLLPLIAVMGPRWQVQAPDAVTRVLGEAAVAPVHAPATVDAERVIATAPGATARRAEALPVAQGTSPASASSNLAPALVYGLPVVLLLATMLLAVGRLFGLRRRATVVTDPQWVMAMARAQKRLKFNRGTALLVSDELNSPVSWGVVQPVIALDPRSAADASQAEAVIAHELAHLDRLDWSKLLLGRLATALFWFNPLVWRLARECHQLREEAVDDAVLSADVRGDVYAQVLVRTARYQTHGALLAANGVAPAFKGLKQRVARVLEPTLRRVPASTGFAFSCAAAALLLAAPLAALSPVSSSSVATPVAATVSAPAQVSRTSHEFVEVELNTAGIVRIRHGAAHDISVVSGDPDDVVVRMVRRGRLGIDSCVDPCEVLLTTPGPLSALSISGSGEIEVEGDFPPQPKLAVAINGSGRIDTRKLPADAVVAAVNGQGDILTQARTGLVAATSGGGDILYLGDPRVQASTSGGGVVRKVTPNDR